VKAEKCFDFSSVAEPLTPAKIRYVESTFN